MTISKMIVKPLAGLGNRLIALASAKRIADYVGVPLEVHWINNKHCMCEYYDLFSAEDSGIGIADSNEVENVENRLYMRKLSETEKSCGLRANPPIVGDAWLARDGRLMVESTKILSMAQDRRRKERDHPYEHWLAEIHSVISGFPVRQSIQGVVTEAQTRDRRIVASCHIRRPAPKGYFGAEEKFGRIGLEAYWRVIDEVLSRSSRSSVVLVASNDPEAIESTFQTFGDRIWFLDNLNYDRAGGGDAVADAFADMLALSLGDVIIRDSASSFGYVASLFGKKPQLLLETDKSTGASRYGFWDFNESFQDDYYPRVLVDAASELFERYCVVDMV